MAEFKIIETQEQLDSIIKDRIERAKKSATEEAETRIKGQYESTIAELTKARDDKETTIKELNSKVAQFETDSLKVKIAMEMGIPYQMASRINGVDEESIRNDASTLASFVNSKPTPPKSNPEPVKKDSPYDSLIKGLKQSNT